MRTPLLACSLLLLAAASANASATHIRWNACYGDGGVTNRDFACDTNAGSEQLECSFTLTVPVSGVWQIDGFVNMAFAASTLPAWWQFVTAGSCRAGSLSARNLPPATAVACVDWADGNRDGLLSYRSTSLGPNGSQIEVLSPMAPAAPFDLNAGQEYFAFTALVNHAKTVGAGACGGCNLGGCMGFVGVRLVRSGPALSIGEPPGDVLITPAGTVDQVVTWQGGVGIAIPNYGGAGWTYCPGATPARNRTWGDVKAIYR